jgi:cellulose synthase/poly-beta-1,6-N-acetylglucosamine synthase-like glycosyltransferase
MDVLFWLCTSLIVYAYVIYPLGLSLLARLRGRPASTTGQEQCPSVSLLIPVYNEADLIQQKLENCRQLEYPAARLECLFGSDGSDDATESLIRAFPDQRNRLFSFKRRGKAATLNDLVEHARGDLLIFSDANSLFEPGAIRALVQHFDDPSIGGVCGKLVLHSPLSQAANESLYWRYENVIKAYEGQLGILASANGAIYAIRRSLYRRLPTHKRIADDLVVAAGVLQQGFRVVYEPRAIAHEKTSTRIAEDLRRKIRVAEISFNALSEIAPLLLPQRGLIAWMLWSHKIIRWAVPLFLIVIFVSSIRLSSHIFYLVIFLAQLAFYTAAVAGYGLERLGRLPRWISFPYYFAGSNLALLLGFVSSFAGRGKATWSRAGR